MYTALYTTKHDIVGFRCCIGDCTRVVRILRGIKMHALRVHNVKQQGELFDGEKTSNNAKPEPVRDERTKLKSAPEFDAMLDRIFESS
jgi:hypothetical protein